MISVAVAIGGFCGALVRYAIGQMMSEADAGFPWSTLLINLSGSLLLGLLLGRAMRRSLPKWLLEGVGTGFLGAYTTFSAFNGQLWAMLHSHEYAYAASYVICSAVIGWMLAWTGVRWGSGRARVCKDG